MTNSKNRLFLLPFIVSQLVVACGNVPAPTRKAPSASGSSSPSDAANSSTTAPGSTPSSSPQVAPPAAAPTGAGAFSLTRSGSTLSLTRGAQTALTMNISRTAPFSGAVVLSASGLPAGVTCAGVEIAAGAASATMTLQASASATLGDASITIAGVSGTLNGSTTVSLTVVEPAPGAPLISGISGTTLARQGAGATTFHIHGNNLAGATAQLSRDSATITVSSVTASSSTDLELVLDIPHGATIASYDLVVTTPAGTANYLSAFTLSAITVRPPDNNSGGNNNGAGHSADPFRTIGHALAYAAQAGDTVFVQAGTIAAPDETFPIHVGAGVKLLGAVSFAVGLGGGIFSYPSVTVRGNLEHTQTGVTANSNDTIIDTFYFEHFAYPVYVSGSNVLIDNIRASNSSAGIFVGLNATATIEDSVFTYNDRGIASGTASLTARRCTIENNASIGWDARNTIALIEDSSISYNGSSVAPRNDGLYAYENARVELHRSQLLDNRTAAIVLVDTSVLTNFVSSTIRSGYWGIYLAGDSGMFVDPDANSHMYLSNGMGYALNDARTGPGDSVLEVYGMTFYPVGNTTGFKEAGTWQGPTSANIADNSIAPTWRIENSGHFIYFQ